MAKTKIIIADDKSIVKNALASLINDYDDFKLVGTAGNGKEAIALLKDIKVDVILMDVEMPVMDGIDATEIIRNKYPEIKIIALSNYDEHYLILHMIESGANGYILKGSEVEELKDAIRTVMKSEYYFNECFTKQMLKDLVCGKNDANHKPVITHFGKREKEILQLIARGYISKEIAKKLKIRKRTVDAIRSNLFKKTGTINTAELVVYAMKNLLINMN